MDKDDKEWQDLWTNKEVESNISKNEKIMKEDKKKSDGKYQEILSVGSLYGDALEKIKQTLVSLEENVFVALKIEKEPVSIADWTKASHNVSKSKGWYDDASGDNFPTKLALIHSEISEVLEEFRNGKGMNEIYYSDKGKPEGVPVELADALIRIFDLAGYFGIDLDKAIKIKHEYNKTRPHRHGGKKC